MTEVVLESPMTGFGQRCEIRDGGGPHSQSATDGINDLLKLRLCTCVAV